MRTVTVSAHIVRLAQELVSERGVPVLTREQEEALIDAIDRWYSISLALPIADDVAEWTMTCSDTARFSLQEDPSADVTFAGDWALMIRSSRANRDGVAADPGLAMEGDASVLAEITPVLEVARSVATRPVSFPEV